MGNLSCQNLSKTFDGVHALDRVTLALPESGITAIIGPNGAGKTTLLGVLTGFVHADSGEVSMGHRRITRWPPHRIARLGIARTFQELRLIRQISTLENILLAQPGRRGESVVGALLDRGAGKEVATNREAAMELLHFVGLEDKAKDNASELSYGQQKLLTLAMCLASQARILLLDEPVAGVHPTVAEKMLSLLVELKKSGKLIVFIEHDMKAVRLVADSIVVMDEGAIIAQGLPAEVLERPEIMEAYIG